MIILIREQQWKDFILTGGVPDYKQTHISKCFLYYSAHFIGLDENLLKTKAFLQKANRTTSTATHMDVPCISPNKNLSPSVTKSAF
jgi:hypothetical protein